MPKDTFNYEGHKTFPKVFWDMRTSSNATFFNRPDTDDIKGAINVQGHKN